MQEADGLLTYRVMRVEAIQEVLFANVFFSIKRDAQPRVSSSSVTAPLNSLLLASQSIVFRRSNVVQTSISSRHAAYVNKRISLYAYGSVMTYPAAVGSVI
jgi:hypothetical protein